MNLSLELRDNYSIKDDKLLKKLLSRFQVSVALVIEGQNGPTDFKQSKENK